MVHHPLPKYIKKTALRRAKEYTWSESDKRADQVARTATCMRCAQSVAKLPALCEKPEDRRCKHCTDGNRGGCTLVPSELNGRLNRLYRLRRAYDTAVGNVANAAARKTDARVQRTGLKLARAQRKFNTELANRRRVAAHSGTPIGVATQVPTTSPQFLGLILAEQRRIASALEALVPLARAIAANNAAEDSDSDESDSDDEGPAAAAAEGGEDDAGEDANGGADE